MTDHQREDAVDRLLRAGLERSAHPASTSACVDPETLAAWMEGSLSREQRSAAEHHAAGCARCQAMLASMARTAPAAAARPAWRTVAFRWLVPIVATATALVLWVAVDRDRISPMAGPARPGVPPTFAGRNQAAPAGSERTPSSGSGTGQLSYPAAVAQSREVADAVAPRMDAKEKPGDPRLEARLEPHASDAPPQRETLARADKPGPPSSAPPAPSVPRSVLPLPLEEPSAKAAGLSERVASADAAASAFAQSATPGATPIDIVSPEPAFRWRVVPPAIIQRSTDGGATWTTQSTRTPGLALLTSGDAAQPVAFTAGSAPARDVCWIVGRAGLVLLSSTGTAWQRRPFPEAADLTAVRAVDARTAVVTTADGRQFSTADGGATWLKIP